jgi:amino acid adenylation domain-containing protein
VETLPVPAFGPRLAYPGRCLPDLVADQARLRPDAVAVEQGDRALTYRELLGATGAVAEALLQRGVGADELVGVCLDRRPELAAALLGVLAAGAGCVPLDPALPPERLRAMAEEAGLTTVVGEYPFSGVDVVPMPVRPAPYRSGPATPATTALVLFTSGSTGRPKGVVLEHRGLTEFVTSFAAFAGLGHDTRFLGFATISFDASVLDLLAPLAAGGTVALADAAHRADPTRLHRFCADHAVNTVYLPAALLPVADPALLPDVRLIITGGEAPGPEQVGRWTEGGRRFVSVYGPTEATVLVTWFEASGHWSRPLPLGVPATNHSVHVVDAALREVAGGEAGELLTGGPGLARGYLGDPVRTAARFVPDPFSGQPGARLYRTGDLARWLPDGTLEFLGRIDRQLKIRGQRVELGEVEAVLRGHPDVRHAAVEALPGPRLVAYVTGGVTAEELRAHCVRRLAEASVPGIVVVDDLPVNANGKVDFARVRELAAGHAVPEQEPPATTAEVQVADGWAAVLGEPPAGRDVDFFSHGGHSITAMRLVTDLRARLRRDVVIEDVLTGRTLRGIAAKAGAAAPAGAEPPVRGRPPALSPAQRRLWFLDRYSPAAGAAYNAALAERLTGPLDVPALTAALAAVAARQQVLRWRVPDADGAPHAVLDPPGPVPLPVVAVAPEELPARLAAGVARPFDLATDTLWRAELFRLGPEEHVLAVYAHHAVFDGWSQALLYDDLAAAYARASAGEPADLPALPATYGDYVAWRAARSDRRGVADLAWWLDHLTGVPTVLQLPSTLARPEEQTYASASVTATLDTAATAEVAAMATRLGATPAAVLLAAFGLVLSWQSGLPDLVVGTPAVDRRDADFEPMVGFFIDIAPLRLRCAGEAGFAHHVRAARDELLAALAHPEAPLERIVDGLGLGGRLDRNPLVQVLFNMYTFPAPRLALAGIASEPVPVTAPGSPFDLTLYGIERDGRLALEILYSTDVYDHARMAAVLAAVARVVAAGAADPDTPVRDLPGAEPVPGAAFDRAERAVPRAVRGAAGAVRPATSTERAVAAVWCEVLGLTAVGATDNFFDVGGSSLTAAAVARRVDRVLSRELRVMDLFRHPTVRLLAEYLDTHVDGSDVAGDPAVAKAVSRGAARRARSRRRAGGPA